MTQRDHFVTRRMLVALPLAWASTRASGLATPVPGTPAAGEPWVDASDFGLVGDGSTDDVDALQAAVDTAAERRRPLLVPPGVYAVTRPLELRSGSRVSAFGASLITYIPELGDPGSAFPTVRIYDVSDVSVDGLSVDGRKDAFAHTQWKHGFGINNARRIRLSHCHANRCKGDGVILADKNVGDVSIDVTVESCTFGQNYRMGGTASGALRATFRNCVFWGTVGTQPMCGFDVEPDRPDVTCQDISFFDCQFIDNGEIGSGEGYGFNVSFVQDAVGEQSGVYLERCTMARNGAAGVDLFRVPRDVALRDCTVVDNAHDGIRVFADASGISIHGGLVAANGHHGIHCAAQPDAPCQRIAIESVHISDNGWRGDAPGNGIHLDHIVRDIGVRGCTVTGSRGYGMYVAPTVAGLDTGEMTYDGNALGDTYP